MPREKLVGTDFSDYFTEPEQAREGYRQVFAKGFVTDYPLTIRHKDGRLTRRADVETPRWTPENRPAIDTLKPATMGVASETSQVYLIPSSGRKSVCTLVRQLRGPHLSMWTWRHAPGSSSSSGCELA